MKYSDDGGHDQPKYRRSSLNLIVEWSEAPEKNQEKK